MPIRDYRCVECGYIEADVYFAREFEVELPESCPECGAKSGWERMLPNVCVRFNGEGFQTPSPRPEGSDKRVKKVIRQDGVTPTGVPATPIPDADD